MDERRPVGPEPPRPAFGDGPVPRPGRVPELIRTYVFLNDPKVRQLTTKFAALLIAAVAITAGIYVAVSGDEGAPLPSEGEGPMASTPTRDCMPAAEYAPWKAEHPDAILTEEEIGPNEVCVSYRAGPPP